MNTTIIIVSYNTAEYLRRCYDSIRSKYPEMPVIIIDGSNNDNECYHYSKSLNGGNTMVKNVGYNIGHGNGMKMGISMCSTDYFLLMDSDAEILVPCIEEMESKMDDSPGAYGVGQIVMVNRNGVNETSGIPYLHPYFALIRRSMYYSYAPAIHHGAPLLKSMIDLYEQGGVVPLISYDLSGKVNHDWKGTRRLNPPEFLSNWEK